VFVLFFQTMSSINHLLEKADKIYRQQVSHRNDLDHLLVCLASGATFHSRNVRGEIICPSIPIM
jgi:hypothetical protein